MKVISIIIASFLIALCLVFSSFIHFPPPITIMDWEGNGFGIPFSFHNPSHTPSPYNLSYLRSPNSIQGTSLEIRWNLDGNQYFGWGIDLRSGSNQGFNASQYQLLSFDLKLNFDASNTAQGQAYNFGFHVKDTHGVEVPVNYPVVFQNIPATQYVEIRLNSAMFHRLDMSSLENINFAVDPNRGHVSRGAFVIDNFQFK